MKKEVVDQLDVYGAVTQYQIKHFVDLDKNLVRDSVEVEEGAAEGVTDIETVEKAVYLVVEVTRLVSLGCLLGYFHHVLETFPKVR